MTHLTQPSNAHERNSQRYLPTSAPTAEPGVCGRTLHDGSHRQQIDPPPCSGRNWLRKMSAPNTRLATAGKRGTL
jgi:hypothetical protein